MQVQMENRPLYIVSAYRLYGAPGINRDNTSELRNTLNTLGMAFKECEGKFAGETEQSFILFNTNRMQAHHFAAKYHQESFLALVPHRDGIYKAYFISVETGKADFAGYFRSMAQKTIEDLGLDYTKTPEGTFFTIWPSDSTCMLDIGCEISHELIKKMEKLG
jgi:hypothetical protein